MAIQMTATELKARILAVLDEVSDGEEVEITKHGHTVARLIPARGGHALLGCLEGKVVTPEGVTDEELFSTGEEWSHDQDNS